MENKHYLYRHIRLDKNEVFYVGIGTKIRRTYYKSIKSEYSRAYKFKELSRSQYWFNIYNKTEIRVEILVESDNYEFIGQKEIEFIKLYGRADLGLGPLVNLTDGGIGRSKFTMSKEHKEKIAENSGLRGKKGKLSHLSKPVFVYNIIGEFIGRWDSLTESCVDLNIKCTSSAARTMQNNHKQCLGYRFFYKSQGNSIQPLLIYGTGCHKIKKVHQLKNGIIINTFNSITEASINTNTSNSNISRACKTGYKANQFNWKYDT